MLKPAKTRVKICGITNVSDALAAVACGADAVGLVFAKSPRQVTVRQAREISRKIGPFVPRVGVFVDEPLSRVAAIMKEAMLDIAQLHGTESPDYATGLAPYRVIKVFRVGEKFAVRSLSRYDVAAHMLETDARVAGGSGQTWDWRRLARVRFAKPIIVTGGLNPDNVQKAIRTLRPYAVDVSSGVEKRPGIKDHKLMEKFIRHAKTV